MLPKSRYQSDRIRSIIHLHYEKYSKEFHVLRCLRGIIGRITFWIRYRSDIRSREIHPGGIAIALIGTIIGAFVCSKPVEKHGRLKALKIIAFLYFVSAVGSAAIIDWYSFLFFRFAGGLAVGASSVVGPMYIAEISPSRWRGRFVAFFQFNIVLGIVLAYFSNYWIHCA